MLSGHRIRKCCEGGRGLPQPPYCATEKDLYQKLGLTATNLVFRETPSRNVGEMPRETASHQRTNGFPLCTGKAPSNPEFPK